MNGDIPKENELEVSLFGPGYGECVLLHIGLGSWVIIDSCIDRRNGKPAALNYLRQIGVNPSDNVKLVVATHWHDDHIKGLGCIINECSEASFVCTTAVRSREFNKLVAIYNGRGLTGLRSGVDEFISIIELLRKRDNVPAFAIADRLIWRTAKKSDDLANDCLIYSLSPSDVEVDRSLQCIASLIPQKSSHQKRVISPSQNDSAVVLWVKIGQNDSFLLGSDLEEKGDKDSGWSAVLNAKSHVSKSSIFKVAHHGSVNGHHPLIWEKMLVNRPWALLTPFTRGHKPLPSSEDLKRLSDHTERVYLTSSISGGLGKIKKHDRLVNRVLKDQTKYIHSLEPPCGHIKMRKLIDDSNDKWNVELKNGAIQVC